MNTVAILEDDLKQLLSDNDHFKKQITELQNRGTEFQLETRELKKEIEKLQEGIRYHRDQKGDDRCWVDDLRLYELLPEGSVGYDPTLPPEETFLENCKRFCRTRQVPVGQLFKKDW